MNYYIRREFHQTIPVDMIDATKTPQVGFFSAIPGVNADPISGHVTPKIEIVDVVGERWVIEQPPGCPLIYC